MIFKPELAKKVSAGAKTVTRRIIKDGERECRYKPNRVYALQSGRGKPSIGQITVMDVCKQRLGEITYKDARKEGFRTTDEFRAYWTTLHGIYDQDQFVWVISFVKGDVTDRPRLLNARPGPPSGDYTDNPARAIRHEAEAVSATSIATFVKDGEANHAKSQRSDWRAQRTRLLAVIAEIRTYAHDPRVDNNLRGIERQVASLDRKIRSVA